MSGKRQPDRAYAPALKQDFIDTAALAAAALWFVIMVLFSWHLNNIPFLTAVERALIGSMIIYATVFTIFHIIIRAALRTERKLHREKLEKKAAALAKRWSNVSEGPVKEK